jgi:hypothetical protein
MLKNCEENYTTPKKVIVERKKRNYIGKRIVLDKGLVRKIIHHKKVICERKYIRKE